MKIMRVCISYTHLYPIKSLNHTSPSRKCKLCFCANMQVASTLWPDIKSEKISKRRFRLIGPSVAQEPLQIHSRQADTSMDQTREAKTAHRNEIGGGWCHGLVGRPPWSSDQARGPHRLNFATCCLLIGPLGQFRESQPVAPSYKYRG